MNLKIIISTSLYISFILITGACADKQTSPSQGAKTDPAAAFRDSMDNEVGVARTTEVINYISLPDGYFLKNTVQLTDEYEGFLFENQQEFDSVLGFGKTAKNEPIHIDYDKNVAVAIARKSKAEDVRITVQGIFKHEDEIKFMFFARDSGPQSFQTSPLFLLYIPKTALHPKRSMQLNGKNIRLHDTF